MMDMFDDDDIFDISDEEIAADIPSSCNPVDDYLIKQLHDVQNRIDQVKKETSHLQSTTRKVLARLYKQFTIFDDDDSSDSDGDWYDENGKPVVKKTKKHIIFDPLLIAEDIWQRVIDDKWIIGVKLQNNSDRLLKALKFFVIIQGQDELRGVTSFWQTNTTLWNRIQDLHPESAEIVTTAVLNLPTFQNASMVTGYGTVVYQYDDKELQTPIRTFKLSTSQVIDKSLTPRHAADLNTSILAIKAVAIEKIITISLKGDLTRAARLFDFLHQKEFTETMPDIYMSQDPDTFRNCIFEIVSLSKAWVKLRISARSTAQLNIILNMMENEFPELAETAKEDKIIDGVIALQQELKLKLECDESAELLNARIITDLFIP